MPMPIYFSAPPVNQKFDDTTEYIRLRALGGPRRVCDIMVCDGKKDGQWLTATLAIEDVEPLIEWLQQAKAHSEANHT